MPCPWPSPNCSRAFSCTLLSWTSRVCCSCLCNTTQSQVCKHCKLTHPALCKYSLGLPQVFSRNSMSSCKSSSRLSCNLCPCCICCMSHSISRTVAYQQSTLLHLALLVIASSAYKMLTIRLRSAQKLHGINLLVLTDSLALPQHHILPQVPTYSWPVAGMLLVDTQMKTLRRPAALSDFLQCQDGHLGDVVDALRSDWLLKVWIASKMSMEACC